MAGLQLQSQRIKPIKSRVEIEIQLSDKRQGDCDSRAKCVLDLLVEYRVIEDDRKKFVKSVIIGWEDVEECVVYIRELEK